MAFLRLIKKSYSCNQRRADYRSKGRGSIKSGEIVSASVKLFGKVVKLLGKVVKLLGKLRTLAVKVLMF